MNIIMTGKVNIKVVLEQTAERPRMTINYKNVSYIETVPAETLKRDGDWSTDSDGIRIGLENDETATFAEKTTYVVICN